jgi:hypothetical protein
MAAKLLSHHALDLRRCSLGGITYLLYATVFSVSARSTAWDDLISRNGSRSRGFDTAGDATDLVIQGGTLLCNRSTCNLRISRWCFRGSNQPRDMTDIGVAVGSWCIIRFRNSAANLRHFFRLKAVPIATT